MENAKLEIDDLVRYQSFPGAKPVFDSLGIVPAINEDHYTVFWYCPNSWSGHRGKHIRDHLYKLKNDIIIGSLVRWKAFKGSLGIITNELHSYYYVFWITPPNNSKNDIDAHFGAKTCIPKSWNYLIKVQ